MPRSAASARSASWQSTVAVQAELLEVRVDRAAGVAVELSTKTQLAGAARERLEPERARAGEEVEHVRAVDRPDQVERRLADEVRRRPRRVALRRVDPAAPRCRR